MSKNWVIVLLLAVTPLYGGWEPPDSTCTSRNLNAAYFTDEDRGWAVGELGTICNSLNGGSTWHIQQEGPYTYDLHDVFFIDSQTGWAVGSSGWLLHTTDGGQNWQGSQITIYDLHAIHFVDADFGVAVGIGGSFFRTTDGGSSWSDTLIHSIPLYDVYFHNGSLGWCAGASIIGRTTNGGRNWDFSSVVGDLYGLSFPDSLHGWACGEAGMLCRTTDGGDSWVCTSIAAYSLSAISFCDSLVGWTVGSSGNVFHTTDGGVNWPAENVGVYDLGDVFFLHQSSGWVCGDEGTILIYTPTRVEEIPSTPCPRGIRNFPNPFRNRTVFSLPQRGDLRIFDASGREVRSFHPSDGLTIVWDGRNRGGRPLPGGLYFYQFRTSNSTIVGTSVLLP